MSNDENKPAEESADGGSPSKDESAKEAPARTEHRSEPGPQFDHAKAWNEAFAKLADLPESILNALSEKASSKKKEDQAVEERVVHQEEPAKDQSQHIESPTPGKKGGQNAEHGLGTKRTPWGHRFLGGKK